MRKELMLAKYNLHYKSADFKKIFGLELRDYYGEGIFIMLGFDLIKFADDISLRHLKIMHTESNESVETLVIKFYSKKAMKLIEELIK